jgi:glyoxylase-like metal-dependent hydrolase (beta-lactamase superfamily II)
VPADEEERFWQALDRDVERRGHPVTVLLTAAWHERSAGVVAERYDAPVWAPALGGTQLARDSATTEELPVGVEQEPVEGSEAGEVALFLVDAKALVVGDIFSGTPAGLDVIASAAPRDAELLVSLERMAELGAELVLPSHGAPVLEHGAAAIRAALDRYVAR